ncbi:TetR/AcrR family transcriptional regulator [Amycolatopsis sp. NBC_01480]|uniref:TetR/AcrR family transcriptional regulator n=1 Tax=Amycolatopsis sp. NBC_01480 TaxID=2903562 RepID=UPI002E2E25A7|nr:helix-turn-helix domain-containing protein [Amycolatopsis sp. NBC_01480]
MLGRRAANAARKEAAVRLAALELSEQVGYSAVSMADIAQRSGVAERTVFRTFGSKAGIFWHDPFLQRLVHHLDPATAALDPLAAVSESAAAAAREMTRQDRDLEARRRALILSEPDLLGVGTQSMGRDIGELARRITPPDADAEQQRRLSLFALFAAMALAFVRMAPDKPVDDWITGLHEALSLAAFGPLTGTTNHSPKGSRPRPQV